MAADDSAEIEILSFDSTKGPCDPVWKAPGEKLADGRYVITIACPQGDDANYYIMRIAVYQTTYISEFIDAASAYLRIPANKLWVGGVFHSTPETTQIRDFARQQRRSMYEVYINLRGTNNEPESPMIKSASKH